MIKKDQQQCFIFDFFKLQRTVSSTCKNHSKNLLIKISLAFSWSRSCRPEVFCKKGVLRNFTKFTVWKHLGHSLFFNKVAGFSLKLLRVAFSLSSDPCFWVSSRFLHRWLNFVTSIGVCMTGLVSISFVFWRYPFPDTVQKIKFSIKNFSSIWDQIHRKLRIW